MKTVYDFNPHFYHHVLLKFIEIFRVFETKINELQDELLVQKGNCAKLDAQLEFSKERYEIMKTNIDSHKKVGAQLLYTVVKEFAKTKTWFSFYFVNLWFKVF